MKLSMWYNLPFPKKALELFIGQTSGRSQLPIHTVVGTHSLQCMYHTYYCAVPRFQQTFHPKSPNNRDKKYNTIHGSVHAQ